MCEEKKIPQEINEEELDMVAGGAMVEGGWKCEFCGKIYPEIATNPQIMAHYNTCKVSPFCGKLKI